MKMAIFWSQAMQVHKGEDPVTTLSLLVWIVVEKSTKKFGQNGYAKIDLGGSEYASSLKLQDDGNMILLGSSHSRMLVLRTYRKREIMDKSFGEKGRLFLKNDEFSSDRASDLIIQPNGDMLLAGVSDDQFIVSRVLGNPYLQNLDKALAFNLEEGCKKIKNNSFNGKLQIFFT